MKRNMLVNDKKIELEGETVAEIGMLLWVVLVLVLATLALYSHSVAVP